MKKEFHKTNTYKVLGVLVDVFPKEIHYKNIAKALKMPIGSVTYTLADLKKRGKVESFGQGYWAMKNYIVDYLYVESDNNHPINLTMVEKEAGKENADISWVHTFTGCVLVQANLDGIQVVEQQ